jgi:hypothetical protein
MDKDEWAATQAAGLVRGPMPTQEDVLRIVKEWRFPPIVKTPDQAVSWLSALQSQFPKNSPIYHSFNTAQGLVYEQFGPGRRTPF